MIPFNPLCEAGEIETLTLLAIATSAVQLSEAVTVLSVREVAVTVMLLIVPPIALDGMVTLSVAFPLPPANTVSGLGNILSDHPALSATVKE